MVLRQRVTVEPPLGATGDGPAYGPPVSIRAHVDERRTRAFTADGQEVTVAATIVTRPEAPIPLQARVTLPSGAVWTVQAVTRTGAPSTRLVALVVSLG